MGRYVLGFHEVDRADLPLVGGKGMNLGELSKMGGIQVPHGFCVTTKAYERMIGENGRVSELIDQLSLLKVIDREQINELASRSAMVLKGPKSPKRSKKRLKALTQMLAAVHMPSDQALQRKICLMPLSPGSKIRI